MSDEARSRPRIRYADMPGVDSGVALMIGGLIVLAFLAATVFGLNRVSRRATAITHESDRTSQRSTDFGER